MGRGEGLSALGAPSRRISTLKVCSEQTPGPSQFVQAIGQKQSNFIIWSKNGKMHFLECKCSNRKALSGVPKATVLPVKVLPLTCTVVLVVAVQQCRTLLSVGAVAVLLTQSPSGHRGVLLRTKHFTLLLSTASGNWHSWNKCNLWGSPEAVWRGEKQQGVLPELGVLSSEIVQRDPHAKVDASSQRLSYTQTTKAVTPVNK